MKNEEEKKRVIFRRIGGRIIPITVGAGLVAHSVKNDRVRTAAKYTVATSRVPLTNIRTHAFRAKNKLLPSTFAITRATGKNAEKVEYIHSFRKGKGEGKAVFKALTLDAKQRGRKFLRGALISPDSLRFSKGEHSKFLVKKHGVKNSSRLVNSGTVRNVLKKLSGFGIKSTTRIPSIRRMKIGFNPRAGKLLFGAAILGYAAKGVYDGK